MSCKYLNRNIIIRKKLLNFILNYLSPTNKFIVSVSQNLDTLLTKRQKLLYLKYKNRQSNSIVNSSESKLNLLRKIA